MLSCDDMGMMSGMNDMLSNHGDWEAVWDCDLRFDYNV